MGSIPGSLVLFLFWALAVATGFGLWAKLEAWLLKVAGEEAPVIVSMPEPEVHEEIIEQPVSEKVIAPPKKKAPAIPPNSVPN